MCDSREFSLYVSESSSYGLHGFESHHAQVNGYLCQVLRGQRVGRSKLICICTCYKLSTNQILKATVIVGLREIWVKWADSLPQNERNSHSMPFKSKRTVSFSMNMNISMMCGFSQFSQISKNYCSFRQRWQKIQPIFNFHSHFPNCARSAFIISISRQQFAFPSLMSFYEVYT